eukprot:173383-Lingulodinium_polyedra.AAC.1
MLLQHRGRRHRRQANALECRKAVGVKHYVANATERQHFAREVHQHLRAARCHDIASGHEPKP